MEVFYALFAVAFFVFILVFIILVLLVISWGANSLGGKIEEKVAKQRPSSYCWMVTLGAAALSTLSFVLLGVVGILPTWWMFRWVRLTWREQNFAFSSGIQERNSKGFVDRP